MARAGWKLTAHQYETHPEGVRCTVCDWVAREAIRESCPGCRRYPWYDALPANLLTQTQLGKEGLRPAPGQPPAGAIYRRRLHDWVLLYDREQAVAKRAPTEAQLAALAKAQAARAEQHRKEWTCEACGSWMEWDPREGKICWTCAEADVTDRAITAARKLVARHDWVVLDTETTGLDGYVVQIAVINDDGQVLLDTLVNPLAPVEAGARAVHGISDEQLAGAPTFADVLPQLRAAVRGRRVVVYNAAFDLGILRADLSRLGEPLEEEGQALGAARWVCAMDIYSRYCAEWSDYHRDWRWQRLPGGDHTALGDCRATERLLREMAATPLSTEERLPAPDTAS